VNLSSLEDRWVLQTVPGENQKGSHGAFHQPPPDRLGQASQACRRFGLDKDALLLRQERLSGLDLSIRHADHASLISGTQLAQ
jgi:hypothetical protein